MYAIIETGGKQYRVQEGQVLLIEKLPAAAGEIFTVDRVLAVSGEDGLRVGTPVITEARVTLRVLEQTKGKKMLVFKYKPKKNYRRRQGHRQLLSRVKVEEISLPA